MRGRYCGCRGGRAASRRGRLAVVATLVRLTGDFDLAEDCWQDALERALTRWPADGIPDNPGGWLHVTARNRGPRRAQAPPHRTGQTRRPACHDPTPAARPGGGRGLRRPAQAAVHVLPPGPARGRPGGADPQDRHRADHPRGGPGLPGVRGHDEPAVAAYQDEDRQRGDRAAGCRRPTGSPSGSTAYSPWSTCCSTRATRPPRVSTLRAGVRREAVRLAGLLVALLPDDDEVAGAARAAAAAALPPGCPGRRRRRAADDGGAGPRPVGPRPIDRGLAELDRARAHGRPPGRTGCRRRSPRCTRPRATPPRPTGPDRGPVRRPARDARTRSSPSTGPSRSAFATAPTRASRRSTRSTCPATTWSRRPAPSSCGAPAGVARRPPPIDGRSSWWARMPNGGCWSAAWPGLAGRPGRAISGR